MNTSLSWTEELARFTFIWTNLLGASLCVKYNAHATVTVIFENLPHKIKQYVLVFIQLVVLAVCYVLIVPGIQFTIQVSRFAQSRDEAEHGLHLYFCSHLGILIVLYTLIILIDTIVQMRGGEN
jgi:TRAP-type C4-dicarboxylate transport system permease small subunit